MVYDLTDFFTSALAGALSEPVEFRVALTERDLYRLARDTEPGIVLLDVESFGPRAVSVVSHLMQEAPRAAICVVSDLVDPLVAGQLLAMGLGCLLPRSRMNIASYVLALQAAFERAGTVTVGTQLLAGMLQASHMEAATRVPDSLAEVDEQLCAILHELVRGGTQPAAAARLHLKPRTIQRRLEHAKTRARARSLLELVIFAERLRCFDDLELPEPP